MKGKRKTPKFGSIKTHKTTEDERLKLRAKLAEDLDAFLSRGGEIRRIPMGVSGPGAEHLL